MSVRHAIRQCVNSISVVYFRLTNSARSSPLRNLQQASRTKLIDSPPGACLSHDRGSEGDSAFHRWATNPAGPHFLLLPVNSSAVFEQNLAQLSAEQRTGVAHYTVRKGDSVASIARRFDTSVTAVRDLNAIHAGRIAVGSDLRVPPSVESLPPKVILAASRVDRQIRFHPVARIRPMQVDRRVASRSE